MKREIHLANPQRYDTMRFSHLGRSGLMLPKVSLGLWQNFGSTSLFERARQMIYRAYDLGINHFDLANNYGPAAGTAESNFGRILREGLLPYRDDMTISTKAGHEMWGGPLGGCCSRKHMISSLDQSLRRMGIDYVDIFYTHRYDGVTPLEETAQALIDIVRSGRAIYVGISKYPPREAAAMYEMLASAGVPAIASQYRYSMFVRDIESETIELAAANGSGIVAFSPLAQGMLTDKYIDGIPADSRAASESIFLTKAQITPERVEQIKALNEIAASRGESLSQMALAWVLRDERVTSLIIGASSVTQIEENIEAIQSEPFSAEELAAIDAITLGEL